MQTIVIKLNVKFGVSTFKNLEIIKYRREKQYARHSLRALFFQHIDHLTKI